jgi:hypothetical protein
MSSAPLDRAARPTPCELIFDRGSFTTERFPLLREQVELRGATTVGELLALPAAGEMLRLLVPEGDGDEHRALIAQVAALLFHAFRYWLHGRKVYRFSENAVRAVIAESPAPWTFRAPAPAGYVQLPRNLFWARPDEAAAAEPVDGFFWSNPEETEGAAGTRFDVLLSLGVREGRPGLTVVPISLEQGSDPAMWADVQVRSDATDFANILPGGELQGYLALTTHAEALKLAVRLFRHIDRHTAHIVEHDDVYFVDHG